MDWMEIAVHTTTEGSDIVSMLLMQLGSQGTSIEDRADIPDPDAPNGYWELIDPALLQSMPEDVLVKGWLSADETLPERIAALEGELRALQAADTEELYGKLTLDRQTVAEADWAEIWKQYYKPFRAGKSLVVKPSWESYAAQPGDKVIEIDPGMAFGTGTHETTAMCMSFLDDLICPGMKVLDVGTGSGILAMGAALLGAEAVTAIDIDPMAVKVARENVARGGLSEKVSVYEGDLLSAAGQDYDLCVANIIADVIMMLASPLKQHVKPGGLFICSGIIKERAEEVVLALENAGYIRLEHTLQGEWAAMVWRT